MDQPDLVKDYLTKIGTSSQHLLSLINDVLDMSRIESGVVKIEEKEVCIPDIIHDLKTIIQGNIQAKQQDLYIDTQDVVHENVITDRLRLNLILLNIVSNAIKFTPVGGLVNIRVSEKPCNRKGFTAFEFRIRDNGIGMSEAFLRKLYEPFTREDNSMTNATQGTGLGLSIARAIIGQMGGNIEVDSKQGGGTTFTVRLDLKLVKEVLPTEKENSQKSRTVDKDFLKGHRIMLVEDNELNREIAYELLSETGLIVDTVKNGQEALDLLKKQPEFFYDLIFMDIQMPVMNGYDATTSIRAGESDYWRNIPVIAMTANVFQEDESRATECGMSGYITKPIDMDVIYTVLEKWLPKSYNG